MTVEKLGNALTFWAYFTASKAGKTGLAPTVYIYEGTNPTPIITATATELARGLYFYVLAGVNVDAVGEYTAIFVTTDTTVDFKEVPGQWSVGRGGVENLDASVNSRATNAGVWANNTRELSAFGFSVNLSTPAPTTAQISAAIWSYLLSNINTVGSVGALIKANLDAAVGSRSTLTASAVNDEITSALDAVRAAQVAAALIDQLTEPDGGLRRFTANSLELAPSNGATSEQVRDEIDAALIAYAVSQLTSSDLDTAILNAGLVDLITTARDAAQEAEAAATSVQTDAAAAHALLDALLQDRIGGGKQFTPEALELAPVGSGGGGGGLSGDPLLTNLGGNFPPNTGYAVLKKILQGQHTIIYSPVDPLTGDMHLYRRQDYTPESNNLVPAWSNLNWQDLTGETVTAYLTLRGFPEVVEVDLSAYALGKTAFFPLPSALMTNWAQGYAGDFEIVVSYAGAGDTVLVEGKIYMED